MLDRKHGWNFSFKPLFIGYTLALLMAVASYLFVTHHHLGPHLLIWTIFGFVIFQAIIQLVFFLHIGLESKPHWYLTTFLFMVLVTILVIGGSLWIMSNLNYNVMPVGEM